MDGQFYTRDGVLYERVTSVLGYFTPPNLVKWQLRVGAKEAKRVKTVSMKIGTNVDDAIRADVMGEQPVKLISDAARNCFKAYKQWREDYNIKDISSATTLFDDEAKIAGTPDLWLIDETCDIKCASSIRENYWLQTEWYARKKGHGFKSILRLDGNLAQYEYKKLPVDDYHLQVFDALITAYRFYNKAPSQMGMEEE